MVELYCDFDDILKSEKPVLVDFYTSWCGHCNTMSPIIEELANNLEGVNFAKVDAEKNPELAKKYNIMGLPTLIIFKCGKVVKEFRGVTGKEKLREELSKDSLFLSC